MLIFFDKFLLVAGAAAAGLAVMGGVCLGVWLAGGRRVMRK